MQGESEPHGYRSQLSSPVVVGVGAEVAAAVVAVAVLTVTAAAATAHVQVAVEWMRQPPFTSYVLNAVLRHHLI